MSTPESQDAKGNLQLDVRTLPPAQRHTTIFTLLGNLEQGNSLVITNDHDPKPLLYQLKALYGETYSFEYLESGPVDWRVSIRREQA